MKLTLDITAEEFNKLPISFQKTIIHLVGLPEVVEKYQANQVIIKQKNLAIAKQNEIDLPWN